MEKSSDKWINRLSKEKRPVTKAEKEYVKSVLRSLVGLGNGGDRGKFGPAGYTVMQVSEFGIDESVEKNFDGVIDEPPKPFKTPEEISKKHNVPLSEIESQLKKGIKVETEHTNDLDQARIIALQHLDEVPNYYDKLKKVEKVSESLSPEVERIANKLPESNFKKRYGERWKQVKIATAQNIAKKKKVDEEIDPTLQPRQQLIAAQKRLAAAKQKQLQQMKKQEQQSGTQVPADDMLEYFIDYVRSNGNLNQIHEIQESEQIENICIDEEFECGFMPLSEAKITGNGRAYDVVFRYHNKVQTVSFFVACDQRPSKSEMQYMVNMFYPNASLLMFTPARETRDNMVLVTAPHKMGKVVYQKEDWEPLTEDESDELDMILEEGEKLGKITRTPGGPKKFMVKVKDPSTGNIKTVRFGDPNLEIKRDDPERRKSFRARHKCDDPGPRTKARYWACRTWEKNKSVSDLTD